MPKSKPGEIIIHDSFSFLLSDSNSNSESPDDILGVCARSIFHHGLKCTMVDICWESINIHSTCEGRIVEVSEAEPLIREKLLMIANQCKSVAENLLEHRRRLLKILGEKEIMKEAKMEDHRRGFEEVSGDEEERNLRTSYVRAERPKPSPSKSRASDLDILALLSGRSG